jgi:hypothetical protein
VNPCRPTTRSPGPVLPFNDAPDKQARTTWILAYSPPGPKRSFVGLQLEELQIVGLVAALHRVSSLLAEGTRVWKNPTEG